MASFKTLSSVFMIILLIHLGSAMYYFPYTSPATKESQPDGRYLRVPDHKLIRPDIIIKTEMCSSETDCVHICMQTPGCGSVNSRTSASPTRDYDVICELLKSKMTVESLVTDVGSQYWGFGKLEQLWIVYSLFERIIAYGSDCSEILSIFT